jgi:hypothetical protein
MPREAWEALQLDARVEKVFQELIESDQGFLLHSGPEGSLSIA